MHKLNDHFVKERLKDIVNLGREILDIRKDDLHTKKATEVIKRLGTEKINQLETIWQKYFEKFLLYLIFSYKKIYPKVMLEDIDGDKKYPDFIGINHYNGLDIIEIKTHLAEILKWDESHKNYYFSAEMSKAITQVKNYMDSISRIRFQNNHDRQKITKYTEEENLYHPRAIIIISSKNKISKNTSGSLEKLRRDFTKLRNGLNDIQILTFDEILNIADEYIANIQ